MKPTMNYVHNRSILVIIEYVKKWVEAKALWTWCVAYHDHLIKESMLSKNDHLHETSHYKINLRMRDMCALHIENYAFSSQK